MKEGRRNIKEKRNIEGRNVKVEGNGKPAITDKAKRK